MVRHLLLSLTHLLCVSVTVCHYGPFFVPPGPLPHGPPPPFRPPPPPFFRHGPSFHEHMMRKHYMSKMLRNRHSHRWIGDYHPNYVVAAEYQYAAGAPRGRVSYSNSFLGRDIPISTSHGGPSGASPYEMHMALKRQRAISAGAFARVEQPGGPVSGLAAAEFSTGSSGPGITSVRASANIRTEAGTRRPTRQQNRRLSRRSRGQRRRRPSGRGGRRINPQSLGTGRTGFPASTRRSGPRKGNPGGGIDASLSAAIQAGDTLVQTDLNVGGASAPSVGSPLPGPTFLDNVVSLEGHAVAGKRAPHSVDVITKFVDMRQPPGTSGISAPNNMDVVPSNPAGVAGATGNGHAGGPAVYVDAISPAASSGGPASIGKNIAAGINHIGAGPSVNSVVDIAAGVGTVGAAPVYPNGPLDMGIVGGKASPAVVEAPGSAFGGAPVSPVDHTIAGSPGGHVDAAGLSGPGGNTQVATTIVEQTVHTDTTMIDQHAQTAAAGAAHGGAVADVASAAGHMIDQTAGAPLDVASSAGHVIDQTVGALSGAGSFLDNLVAAADPTAGGPNAIYDPLHSNAVVIAGDAGHSQATGAGHSQAAGAGHSVALDSLHSATGGLNTVPVDQGTAAGGANDFISAHTMIDPYVQTGNVVTDPANSGAQTVLDLSNFGGSVVGTGGTPMAIDHLNSLEQSPNFIGNGGSAVGTSSKTGHTQQISGSKSHVGSPVM